jgi:fatty-acyl-CoA synthase
MQNGFSRSGNIGKLREDGSFVYGPWCGDAVRLAGFLDSQIEYAMF